MHFRIFFCRFLECSEACSNRRQRFVRGWLNLCSVSDPIDGLSHRVAVIEYNFRNIKRVVHNRAESFVGILHGLRDRRRVLGCMVQYLGLWEILH